MQSIDESRYNKNDYYLAALLHENAPRGNADLARKYRQLSGR